VNNVFGYFKLTCAGIGAFVGYVLGGYDALIIVLFIFTIIDLITGFIKSLLGNSDKTEFGKFSSREMWAGGIRKVLIFVVVAMAVLIDRIVFIDKQILRDMVIFYYIANEGVSILENIGLCGVTYPDQLKKALEQLHKKEKKLGEILIEKKIITQDQLDDLLNEQLGIEINTIINLK